jgi:hypothetical protein
MTGKDRANQWVALSVDMADFLASTGRPMDAGSLVSKFCKERRVALADAEVALSILLNQRSVVVDREMRLESRGRVAA